jgi:ATP-dependent Clp protease adaptor protein ClpS
MTQGTQSTQQANAPAAVEPVKKKDQPELPPPCRVLLHNDDVNVFEDVVRIVQRLTPLSEREALQRTVEAHTKGVALLLTTHKERAELYVEQLTSAGLTVTMEEGQ